MNNAEFRQLVRDTRSTRRFKGQVELSNETLRNLVDLARTTPSSRNQQALKFVIVSGNNIRDQVFICLGWAAALEDWVGPDKDERPGGYIVILGDRQVSEQFSCDHGIAAQTIMLGAKCGGYGGCILASIDHDRLRTMLGIEERFDILLMLALGEPAEEVEIEPMPDSGSVNYWRDGEGVHHVPKRSLEEVIVGEF